MSLYWIGYMTGVVQGGGVAVMACTLLWLVARRPKRTRKEGGR